MSYLHFTTKHLQRKRKPFNKYFHKKPAGVLFCLSFQFCQGNLSPEGLPFPQAKIWLQLNDYWVCQPDDNSKTNFSEVNFFSYLNTRTDSENESEHRSNEHYLGLFFTAAWEVFITAMFSFIFTSLTAVHIYDFHIFTVTHKHTHPKKHKKKSKNTNNTTEKRKNKEKEVLVISLYRFLGFWSYLLRYDRLELLSMRYFDSADSFCRRLIACTG